MDIFIFLISSIYFYTIISISSLIVNLRYYIYFWFNDLLGNIKNKLDLYTTEVYNIDSLLKTMRKIVPEYYHDPLKGTLNWLGWTIITLGRTLYLPHEKHSKDCYEHARTLKYLIDNSIISKKKFVHNDVEKKYIKTEICLLLSKYPFIKNNHAITIGYWECEKDIMIDIFSPYEFLGTINKKEIKNIPEIIENYYLETVKYSKYWITLRI